MPLATHLAGITRCNGKHILVQLFGNDTITLYNHVSSYRGSGKKWTTFYHTILLRMIAIK